MLDGFVFSHLSLPLTLQHGGCWRAHLPSPLPSLAPSRLHPPLVPSSLCCATFGPVGIGKRMRLCLSCCQGCIGRFLFRRRGKSGSLRKLVVGAWFHRSFLESGWSCVWRRGHSSSRSDKFVLPFPVGGVQPVPLLFGGLDTVLLSLPSSIRPWIIGHRSLPLRLRQHLVVASYRRWGQ